MKSCIDCRYYRDMMCELLDDVEEAREIPMDSIIDNPPPWCPLNDFDSIDDEEIFDEE